MGIFIFFRILSIDLRERRKGAEEEGDGKGETLADAMLSVEPGSGA